MDLQFFGANCVVLSYKGARIVVDDNLKELGAKTVTKPDDVALFTAKHTESSGRITFDRPGEYEVSDISIIGIAARAHTDEVGQFSATMFKLMAGDQSVLVTGHIYPDLSDSQLESIGIVDVMVVPVGGNGYTTDPIGALKLIKAIEPKLVIPTHYADNSLKFPVPQQDLADALKEIAMEPKETIAKLRLKPGELSDVTQLIVLEKA
jgi:L-ascorbate metabolism protein UlaG (beta-lactamase superfamily)